jgi:C4-dicarboxylate-specific signal transduction histidine kinase
MNQLKRKEVAFFGKITAGITHEIKNVLAIIQQSSGLMEDILDVTENGAFPHKDKFIKSMDRIRGQIQRGIGITTHLNRFAHSPDQRPASLNLNEVTEQMVLLASRFARLKNVALESSPLDPPLIMKSDPVTVEMALFESIEILLNAIDSGGKITLSSRKTQGNFELGVSYEHTVLPEKESLTDISSTESWESLQQIMTSLSGTAKMLDQTLEILLVFPESIDG